MGSTPILFNLILIEWSKVMKDGYGLGSILVAKDGYVMGKEFCDGKSFEGCDL